LAETAPHSLQRKSPGLGLRVGFPKWQAIGRALCVVYAHYSGNRTRCSGWTTKIVPALNAARRLREGCLRR
jgi:hypothetical protein